MQGLPLTVHIPLQFLLPSTFTTKRKQAGNTVLKLAFWFQTVLHCKLLVYWTTEQIPNQQNFSCQHTRYLTILDLWYRKEKAPTYLSASPPPDALDKKKIFYGLTLDSKPVSPDLTASGLELPLVCNPFEFWTLCLLKSLWKLSVNMLHVLPAWHENYHFISQICFQ